MIRTQVYLPDDLYYSLKKMSLLKKVSFAELVRKGAERIVPKSHHKKALKKVQNPLSAMMALAHSREASVPDLSTNHDKYLCDTM